MQWVKVASSEITRIKNDKRSNEVDLLVVEEPMEIRIIYGALDERKENSLAVTMRTPGNDFELTLGFLFAEGIIASYSDVLSIVHCEQIKSEEERGNVVKVSVQPNVSIETSKLDRNFYMTSSCGVCGKSSIDALAFHCGEINSALKLKSSILQNAPNVMRKEQNVFEHTGGLHAAALFDKKGNIVLLREDVGRHNALDKLIGAALVEEKLPLSNYFVMVSGRIGFELVQKAIVAGIPILGAVGAPSSLAVDLAKQYQLTVAGFVKKERFNIYSGKERIYEN